MADVEDIMYLRGFKLGRQVELKRILADSANDFERSGEVWRERTAGVELRAFVLFEVDEH